MEECRRNSNKKLKQSNYDGSTTVDEVNEIEVASSQEEDATTRHRRHYHHRHRHRHHPSRQEGDSQQEKNNKKKMKNQQVQRRQRQHVINICIVESHQHALEHIHNAMKKQRIVNIQRNNDSDDSSNSSWWWKMVHFDAHPDLACSPSIPAMSCFVPRQPELWYHQHNNNNSNNDNDQTNNYRDLYELLDCSSSGIAEWIMPLVVGGNLQYIEWIKPKFSRQLPLGHHTFNVGCTYDNSSHDDNDDDVTSFSFLDLLPSSRIKVDWNHPYYLDDDSVVDTTTTTDNKLLLSKQLTLHVRELLLTTTEEEEQQETTTTTTETTIETTNPAAATIAAAATTTTATITTTPYPSTPPPPSSRSSSQPSIPCWSLDICLDYFTCLNPFVEELELLDSKLYHALDQVIYQSKCFYRYYNYYNNNNNNNNSNDINYYHQRNHHRDSSSNNNNNKSSSSLYQQELFTFRKLVIELLTVCSSKDDRRNNNNNNNIKSSYEIETTIIKKLLPYYDYTDNNNNTVVDGPTLLTELCNAVKKASSSSLDDVVVTAEGCDIKEGVDTIDNNNKNNNDKNKNGEEVIVMNKAVTLAIEAVPYWNMPHDRSSLQEDQITKSLSQVEHELMSRSSCGTSTRRENYLRRPFVITIARSSIDKFTDPTVVEDLQQRVLTMLRRIYCTCTTTSTTTTEGEPATATTTASSTSSAKVGSDGDPAESCQCLKVILDYGQWEGTYEENS